MGHFRCARPDVAGLRIDVMARMRGVDPFPDLWVRRFMYCGVPLCQQT